MFRPVSRVPGCALVAALVLTLISAGEGQQAPAAIRLPEVRRDGRMSLEAALWARRSVRAFTRDAISLSDVGQLLWAAQGANRPDGHRTVPSAGATYPLELYLLASRVDGLAAGVYRYRSAGHTLELATAGDRLPDLVASAARQPWIADAAIVIVLAAVPERTARRYGERADRFIALEAGHAGQSICLQAVALGLGTTVVGAAVDTATARIVGFQAGERLMDLLPVGRPR
jgi:SagB-type dehydrogenase family enzyme